MLSDIAYLRMYRLRACGSPGGLAEQVNMQNHAKREVGNDSNSDQGDDDKSQ